MEIKLLAFDSLGVRSQSTFIQTEDTIIHIDPAAALAPRRFGLPPHRIEIERLHELAEIIADHLRDAELVIITHYHYDHHDPNRLIPVELYRGKEVYVKHPTEKINISQKIRASRFLKMIKQYAKDIKIADNSVVVKGKTVIKFSEPVPHGINDRLGYVVEVMVHSNGGSVLYTSDVEGPVLENQLRFIVNEKPELAIVDGPLTYMLGYRFSYEDLDRAIRNLKKIVSSGVKTIILDHHLVRDPDYMERISEVLNYARTFKVKVLTAAEYMGKPVNVLEVKRKELYREERN